MQLTIRRYRPSDKDAVRTLFSTGTIEHVQTCFYNAMTSLLYITITLTLCVAGFLYGSLLGAVVLPGVWVSFVYYCCYESYASYVRERLRTDMQDIPGNFLGRPDDCFWVAEAEIKGRAQLIAMVAVVTKESGGEKHAELFRMIISPSFRQMGLGTKMTQTVLDFCKERGVSEVVLDTSTTQTPAVALYKKMGFSHVCSHFETEAPTWILRMARIRILRMKKQL